MTTVLGTCHHDCPDSCGWVVTVEDGVATRLRGNPAHPFSQGELCPKVNHFLDRVYSPDRVTEPLKRVGPKGEGRFEPIGWDEALALAAARLHAVIDQHGGEAVYPWWDAGNQSMLACGGLSNRFFDRIGSSLMTGALCGETAKYGTASTTGTGQGMDPMDLRHSRYIILWGTNTRMTNRHLWPFIEEARAAGATVVVIDPVRTITAEAADWFIQPLPGTDAALALGMMHVLVRDGLVDDDYVERHTSGYTELRGRLAEWPPERAAAVCGLDAGDIERLARAYGTTRPAAIRMLIGAEHREHGAMIFRTVSCLPLLVGAWRDLGGGFCRSVGTWASGTVDALAVAGPSLHHGGRRREINMSHLGRALTDPAMDPPIHALVVWNGNPLVSVPNTELIRQGLARDDLFTIVHEQFLTDTARYADLVLPATTQIEQRDLMPAWGHLYLGWNEAAIAPVGGSVANTELFRRLSAAMGFTEPELFTTDDELLDAALHRLDPVDRESLERDGFVRLPLPVDLRPFAAGGFPTADGRARFFSADLAAAGHDPLPTYVAPREGPGGDPHLTSRFPLVMLTTKSQTRFLNSSYSHLPKHGPPEGRPVLDIDPLDASARGIGDGDEVRIWNDRASLTMPVRVTDRVRPGVVSMPFGWWMHQHADGSVANSLTNDTLADWGGGVAFHDTLVQVELARKMHPQTGQTRASST